MLEKYFENTDVHRFLETNYVYPTSSGSNIRRIMDKIKDRHSRAVPIFYGRLKLQHSGVVETQKFSKAREYYLEISDSKNPNSLAMYYLPWEMGSYFTARIKEGKDEAPRFFVTNIMEGCTLTISGNVYEPVITHLNRIDINLTVQEKFGLDEEHQRIALYKKRAKHTTLQAKKLQNPSDKYKYIKTRGVAVQPLDYRGFTGPRKVAATQTFVDKSKNMIGPKKEYNIKRNYMETKALCYGVRTSAGWKFYMVKFVIGNIKTRKTRLKKWAKPVNVYFPITKIEIFPEHQNFQLLSC